MHFRNSGEAGGREDIGGWVRGRVIRAFSDDKSLFIISDFAVLTRKIKKISSQRKLGLGGGRRGRREERCVDPFVTSL